MGPSLIFDKSTLQSLNADEAMWLDNFYIANVTPLFFVETLADLKKEVHSGKTPEQVVGIIASKTPQNGCVNVHHNSLLHAELTGQTTIEMTGRPIIAGGRFVKLGDETGVIYHEPPEIEAFKRWQKHEFLEVERLIAKKWREELLIGATPDEIRRKFQGFLDAFGVPESFHELKNIVDTIMNSKAKEQILCFGLSVVGVQQESQIEIVDRWKQAGKPDIKVFSPYFFHVMSVDLFFFLGTAAKLFSSFGHAQTHMIDMAYLYYLPFCKVFTSNDNLHIKVAPLFLEPDQIFLKGNDLKKELNKLDQHYYAFPDHIKAQGVMIFATIPPDDISFLTTKIWDTHMSPEWRNIRPRKFDGTDVIDPETDRKIIEKIQNFTNNAQDVDSSSTKNPNEADQMVVSRIISKKRGKWRMVSPEIENSKKRIIK